MSFLKSKIEIFFYFILTKRVPQSHFYSDFTISPQVQYYLMELIFENLTYNGKLNIDLQATTGES